MKRSSWIDLVPSLLLAAGILASTGIAVAASESGWWVLAGPLVMALAIAATGVLGVRRFAAPRGTLWVALILGASLLLASAIVALRDPKDVAALLPVLGACVAAPLGMRLGTGSESTSRRCSAATTR